MDRVILLDTHVLLWWFLARNRLSRVALRAVSKASTRFLADISLREVAVLVEQERLSLEGPTADWLRQAIQELELEVVEISPEIAARSTRIAPNFHGDPADQLIAATAIELDVPLVTADERLRASPAVRTIW
ncbi:MAG TPA: type II toxin-antitoxin system VapC family toxin [Archangium sp.]